MTITAISKGTWTGFLGRGLALREMEATLLAAGGMTMKQIAREMGVTPKAVEKGLENARFKMDCRTLRDLVVASLTQGLIALSTPAQAPQNQEDGDKNQSVFLA
ncbi:helix-turn-helix transcriptional regulator [Pseudomonas sp. G.S.17]|uniref:helix-turn-helix transcriptional regulator n=1 Tax=Pseudomonas sp. G.S.17 TaxID=3137451 RepID=UPI00311CBA04